MATSKPIFVIVTSDACAHCHIFRAKELDNVKNRLIKEGKVNIVEINSKTMTANAGDDYHPNLSKYIRWFPTFFLFTADSWNNKNIALVGKVLGGEFVDGPNGQELKPKPGVGRDVDGITKWVDDTLKNPIFQNNNQNNRTQSRSYNPKTPTSGFSNRDLNSALGSYKVNSSVHPESIRSGLPRFGVATPRNPHINPSQLQQQFHPSMTPRLPPPATPRLPMPVQTPTQMNRRSPFDLNGRPPTQPTLRLPPIDTDSQGNSNGTSTNSRTPDIRFANDVGRWDSYQNTPNNDSYSNGHNYRYPSSAGLTDRGSIIRYEPGDIPSDPS